jgi:ISXO2-like transposase domain
MSNDGGSRVGKELPKHLTINHSIGEYVRGDVHTNTIEGYFSILKRGIIGTYHHVSPQHLKRYLAEFDFRYNERTAIGVNDEARTDKLIRGITEKMSDVSGLVSGVGIKPKQLELPMAMLRTKKLADTANGPNIGSRSTPIALKQFQWID